MTTRPIEIRCAPRGQGCEHVIALTRAGELAIHVMHLPEQGQRLLEHARLLAELHAYGVDRHNRATLQEPT